jgi:DNA-binding CsgD family transcriptional regulator
MLQKIRGTADQFSQREIEDIERWIAEAEAAGRQIKILTPPELSYEEVLHELRRKGLDQPSEPGSTSDPALISQVRHLASLKMSGAEIAERLLISPPTVRQIARANDIAVTDARTRARVTPEIRAEIKRLYGKISRANLAAHLGLGLSTLDRVLAQIRAANINRSTLRKNQPRPSRATPRSNTHRPGKVTPSLRAQILAAAGTGSHETLAKRFGLGSTTIRRVLIAGGVNSGCTRNRIAPETEQLILACRAQGQTIKAIAGRFSLSPASIRNVLARATFEVRERTPRPEAA